MKITSKYVYFSRFVPNINAGGGCRRLVQIEQVFANIGFELISPRTTVLDANPSLFSKVFNVLKPRLKVIALIDKYFIIGGEYHLWHKDRREYVYHLKLFSRQCACSIENFSDIELAMVDDPIYFAPLIKKLKTYGMPIIGMCQNIESLVHGQITDKGQRILFNKELDILSLCNVVMTISREENVILNNFNINALFLPYYPADPIIKQLLKIREKRKRCDKKDIILLGTAGNKPTKRGMISAINAWKEHNLSRVCGRLIVAGYGTEDLKKISYGNDIVFLGPLTNEELEKRLNIVKACLCYQEKGSGALTRITEMLIAGVPVLANSHAARSHYNFKGVIEFSCFDEFEKAIRRVDLIEGNIPVPKPPDVSNLVSSLRKFIN